MKTCKGCSSFFGSCAYFALNTEYQHNSENCPCKECIVKITCNMNKMKNCCKFSKFISRFEIRQSKVFVLNSFKDFINNGK